MIEEFSRFIDVLLDVAKSELSEMPVDCKLESLSVDAGETRASFWISIKRNPRPSPASGLSAKNTTGYLPQYSPNFYGLS